MLLPGFLQNRFDWAKLAQGDQSDDSEPVSDFSAFDLPQGTALVITYREPSAALLRAARICSEVDSFAIRFVEQATDMALSTTGVELDVSELPSRTRRAWERYTENVSIDGESLAELQFRLVETLIRDGEDISRMHPGNLVELVDVGLIDYGHKWLGNEDHFRNDGGVIVDDKDRPLYYDIRTPQGIDRVPASEIIHTKREKDRWRTRGKSWLAPALPKLQELSYYTTAFMQGAKISLRAPVYATLPETVSAATRRALEDMQVDLTSNPKMRFLEDGVMVHVVDLSKNFDGDTFDKIRFELISEAAAGLRVTYDFISGDASKANMSSLQSANVSNMTFIRGIQRIVYYYTLQLYYRWVLSGIARRVLNPQIASLKPKPKFPHIPSMIPHRDAEVSVKLIGAGALSPQTDMESRGLDPEVEMDRIEEYTERIGSPIGANEADNPDERAVDDDDRRRVE